MFDVIGVTRGHCEFCNRYDLLAVLQEYPVENGHDTRACESCWRATHLAADLLKLVRLAKAPKGKAAPKKPRKPARGQPSHDAPYSGPSKHEVGSLVPVDGDRSP